jgi:hypothetical protein
MMLAHMGRYENKEQFFNFLDSGLMDFPTVFLEMSSATEPDVYAKVVERKELWSRLVFGSDLPFGTICGVEYHSEETGPTFICRDKHPWSKPVVDNRFGDLTKILTYNTYHTIKALKDGMEKAGITGADAEHLKQRVFHDTILSILEN